MFIDKKVIYVLCEVCFLKITFIHMGMENLGIEYLAASLRREGHSVNLLFDPAIFTGRLTIHSEFLGKLFSLRRKIVSNVLKEKPDVAAFSCFTGMFDWAKTIANDIKSEAHSIKIVFGGIHTTLLPERVISEEAIDAIAVGESEYSFSLLLSAWQKSADSIDIPGIWTKSAGDVFRPSEKYFINKDLNTLPFPEKDIFYEKVPSLSENYMIMTTRGCPYSCSYCCNMNPDVRKTRQHFRRRSVSNAVEELKWAKKRYDYNIAVFRDDIFTLEKQWMAEFVDRYSSDVGSPYFCYSHPSLMDVEYADMLAESKCVIVNIGVQSADPEIRKNILNRNYTNDDVRRSVSLLKERSIKVAIDHMIGVPNDLIESQKMAVALYNEMRPYRILSFWLTYYPGTEITKIARDNNLISDEDVENIESGKTAHRYSGGNARGTLIRKFRKISNLITLITLLPAPVIDFFNNKERYRFIPSGIGFYTIVVFINAIVSKDQLFLYMLKYFFSKKKLP